MDSKPGRSPRLWPLQEPGSRVEFRRGRSFVVGADDTAVVAVNDSAAAIWDLCDGKTAVDEMVAAICEMSSLPLGQVTADVEATVKMFEQSGLVTLRHEPGTPTL